MKRWKSRFRELLLLRKKEGKTPMKGMANSFEGIETIYQMTGIRFDVQCGKCEKEVDNLAVEIDDVNMSLRLIAECHGDRWRNTYMQNALYTYQNNRKPFKINVFKIKGLKQEGVSGEMSLGGDKESIIGYSENFEGDDFYSGESLGSSGMSSDDYNKDPYRWSKAKLVKALKKAEKSNGLTVKKAVLKKRSKRSFDL